MSTSTVRALGLPLVAVILVVVAALAPSAGRDDPARTPSSVGVSQSTYACPAGSVITVASGQVEPGTSAEASVLPARTAADGLGGATSWRTAVVAGPGVIVEQKGRAAGAVGYFAGVAPKAGGGGLVVGSCSGNVDDAWLLGLGSGNKHFSTLILTNLSASPAAVDLTLWGPEGKIDAVNADGIVIDPYTVRRIRLDELAAGESELAIHVERRRGSVSAVVNDTSTSTFKGTEPVSPALSPRREQVVGGLVEGTAGRTLLVLNPGDTSARVDVEVIGPDGTFTPSGLDQVKVEAGTVRAITVPKSAGSQEQALRITSDQPVTSTVRMAPSTDDYAYAEPVAALAGPAVVPIDVGRQSSVPRLVLTAPQGKASVEVQAYAADMSPLTSTTVTIAAGTTKAVRPDAAGAAYLVIRPKGQVVAAATYVKGGGISSLALVDAPISVRGPQVRPAG